MLKIVKTENGSVRGLPGNNTRITAFKGIPYAAPPVGKNRWKAPMPCENWTGIRDAYTYGPISVQDTPGIGTDVYCREWHVDSQIPMDEDCLYLNVWTGANSDDDKLPVIVWIHGGGFQWGYSPEMEFNGENIAKRGVVVVSMGYRLGTLGFLAHPEITKENPDAPANFGLLDQKAAIEWVKRNIKNFGGDPDNITLAGQSAGGASVLTQITSPQSMDMIDKAIIFSGIISGPYEIDKFISPQTLEYGEEIGKKFFDYLGISTLDEARKLDAFVLRDKYAEFRQSNPMVAPVIDERFIMDNPLSLLISGKHNHIPLISGNTGDEFPTAICAKSREEFEEKAKEYFGDKTDKFLSFEETKEVNENFYAPCSSIEYAVKAGLSGINADTYYYSFEPDIPGEDNAGTFHSVDLWFFFETLAGSWRPFVGRHYDLARKMCNYITNFAKTGNPNGKDSDGSDMETWLPYSEEAKNEMRFTADGPKATVENSEYKAFLTNHIKNRDRIVKKQAVNPYLPSWEYIPDGEPYVFGNRVYVYGSHDNYDGCGFCLNDYVCWSAPVDDLGNWRYEGVTYTRLDDPENKRNNMCLYAPDVCQGADGRYYLFYVLDKISVVSVAVCDTPAGKYEFLGYVHYKDGTRLGEREGDEPQFDPGVILVDNKVYLYTGFCGIGDKSRSGAMMTVLDTDMLTILEDPQIIVPGSCYSQGTEYENHAFFEAPSIRCFDNKYYFIYSSEVMHELCYATSDSPKGPFKYGGVIVSNADMHIDSYKPADKPTAFGANNHGSLIEIAGKRYIFYHRQTLNSWYSRQGCAEPVTFNADGSIVQCEITSCGLNGGPLNDKEEYPGYIACNLFTDNRDIYVGGWQLPYIKQEGKDGDHNLGYVADLHDGANIGFKYFDCKDIKGIVLYARGYATGAFEIRTSIDGPVLAKLPVEHSTIWEPYTADCAIPDGVNSLYIRYTGGGVAELKSFKFLH